MELFNNKRIMTMKGQPVKDINEILKDNLVALFFSSSWCLATRQFLPLFKQFCADVRKRKGSFKVVCVPFDKTETDMLSFYEEMPDDWMTLAFDEQCTILDLRDKYKVNVVPKLLVLNTDNGDLLSHMARKEVQDKGVAAYRNWYDTFRPPMMRRKMKAAVVAIMMMKGMQNISDSRATSSSQPSSMAAPESTNEQKQNEHSTWSS